MSSIRSILPGISTTTAPDSTLTSEPTDLKNEFRDTSRQLIGTVLSELSPFHYQRLLELQTGDLNIKSIVSELIQLAKNGKQAPAVTNGFAQLSPELKEKILSNISRGMGLGAAVGIVNHLVNSYQTYDNIDDVVNTLERESKEGDTRHLGTFKKILQYGSAGTVQAFLMSSPVMGTLMGAVLATTGSVSMSVFLPIAGVASAVYLTKEYAPIAADFIDEASQTLGLYARKGVRYLSEQAEKISRYFTTGP